MNARSVKVLAVVVIVLLGLLFALNPGNRDESPEGSDLMFPALKTRLNDLSLVTVTDADGTITMNREGGTGDGRWIVPEHGGYPADTVKLRQLLLALANAARVEQKTSDPELYERLGVADPREDGGNGVLVTAAANDEPISLILGDSAQGEFRYARIPEQVESWLIDQNPQIPEDSGGWLLSDIVNIDASRIQSAAIRHSDGEVVSIRKEAARQSNFEVENIPEGRELSYPSVANGIAGALSNLTLEAVRAAGAPDQEASATAEFATFDGLEVRVSIFSQDAGDGSADEDADEQHWITLEASVSEANKQDDEPAETDPANSDPADGGPAEDDSAGDNPAENDPGAAAETAGERDPTEEKDDPADEAAAINQRVGGWAYRISTYKADQLTRRWEDILRDESEAS
ncbi:MAG: DUF4340 domain-containing protein [Woeseia sp.]